MEVGQDRLDPLDLEVACFEAALKQVPKQPPPDLLLVAGRTLEAMPDTRALPRTAIVFEARNGGRRSWYLAAKARRSRLRVDQLVYKHDNVTELGQLARLVARRGGLIQYPNISLLLLICSENNALNTRNKSSVLRESRGGLHGILGQRPWIVLNPAHNPYRSRSRPTGYAKIGPVAGYDPTLERLVHDQWHYHDGTRAPIAVIHCNNFNDKNWTHKVASRCFALQSHELSRAAGPEWRYVLYELLL
jgi:hypothetical protein